MDSLFVLRERIREVYAKHSKVIDKVIQFILALVTFYLINSNVGFMKVAATPVVMLALAIICTFFPLTMTIIAATVLILAHMFAVSLGALIVTAGVFLVMYIFYFRLTPKMALVVLLTPITFAFKVPYILPIAYGLIGTPIAMVAVGCGTIVFYMMEYVKKASAGMKGKDAPGLMGQISAYLKQVFQNKEMWIVIVAFIICMLVVYAVRRMSVNHAWKVAIVAGAVVNIVTITIGDIALGVHTSYGALIIGNVAAIVIGLVLELFFFSVDYARCENLQYEDDEYYYYVKAVPKLSVATPEKTVKRINERQETEIIDAAEVRKRTGKKAKPPVKKAERADAPAGRRRSAKKGPAAKRHDMEEVDKMLLTQSLKKDLDLK